LLKPSVYLAALALASQTTPHAFYDYPLATWPNNTPYHQRSLKHHKPRSSFSLGHTLYLTIQLSMGDEKKPKPAASGDRSIVKLFVNGRTTDMLATLCLTTTIQQSRILQHLPQPLQQNHPSNLPCLSRYVNSSKQRSKLHLQLQRHPRILKSPQATVTASLSTHAKPPNEPPSTCRCRLL